MQCLLKAHACIPHFLCQLLAIFVHLTLANLSVLAAPTRVIAFSVSVYTDAFTS